MRTSQLLSMICILTVVMAGPVAAQELAEEETPEETAVPVALDEIVVTARYSLLRDEPVTVVDLNREQIMELPHFGDDLFRAVSILPGISSKDFSARFNVRGGPHEELLVRLDGLELFEPFHLEDFEGVFNILDPEVIGAVDLIPGSYPAEYGDRMSGVLDLTTSRPSQLRTNLGVSFSNLWVGGSGSFAEDKGRWLSSARRGYLDLIMNFVGEDQGKSDDDEWKPRYWDLFTKLDYDLNPSHSVSFKLLSADDSLTIDEVDGAEELTLRTAYGNSTLGASHRAILGSKTVVESIVSAARVDRDRSILWSEYAEHFDMLDDRVLDVLDLRQDWSIAASDRHYLKAGLQARSCDADYDYFNEIEDDNFIDDPRFPPPVRTTRYLGVESGEQYSLWIADRTRIGKHLTAEVGGRYDEQTLADDSQASPRLNLVWELAEESVLRAGWGHFYQSQRVHELDVEFGETEFYPVQRAEHLNLGFEKRWFQGYSLRIDAYRREVRDPRPRYETLFNPFEPIAEVAPDLIRIAPDSVLAEGVETYLRSPVRRKLNWWLSYTFSSIEDEVDGRKQLRSNDQPHAFTANANWHVGEKWNLNWVWLFHTGWPATDVSGEWVREPDGSGRLAYTVGPFYAERWPDYHRLDLRASRVTRLRNGRLTFFVDVQNLYDQNNLRGIEIDGWSWVQQPDGGYTPVFNEESWFGIMPSLGLSWER
ncbi:MAG: TonB-dependent receptor [bacterium]|nr:TonB-dependent receptor [bacterium]